MRKFFSLPIDYLALVIPIIILSISIITIFTITYQDHGYRLATDQTIFTVLGLGVFSFFMFSDYRILQSYAWPAYILSIILLVLLLPPIAQALPFTPRVFGVYRWIDLGLFQIQPSEIFKAVAAIISAKILADKIGQINIKTLLFYMACGALPLAMIYVQPDLGTMMVVFVIFLAVFLVAKPSMKMLLALLALLLIAGGLVYGSLQDYQITRIETFLNPGSDPLGAGYNVRQSLIAVGSGGLSGRGFGQGSQTVLNFLPVPHADFIFAGYAEATGFIGSTILLMLYVILVFRALAIARDSKDPFGQLLAFAIAAKFFFQSIIHIGMNVGLMPVTGIPLPLMSYGGTALIIDMMLLGILQSIAIRHKRTVFG